MKTALTACGAAGVLYSTVGTSINLARGNGHGSDPMPAPILPPAPTPTSTPIPTLPSGWMQSGRGIRSAYEDLVQAYGGGPNGNQTGGLSINDGIAGLRKAIAPVGGHPNIQKAMNDIAKSANFSSGLNASSGSNASGLNGLGSSSLFTPKISRAMDLSALQNAALKDGVDFANATAGILPANYTTHGKPLNDTFEGSTASQQNRGDCVVVAMCQGAGDFEAGQQLLNNSVRALENGSYLVRLQGQGPNAIYAVSEADLDNPNNNWVKGSKGLQIIGAGLNTALSVDGSTGIGNGSNVKTIYDAMIGPSMGYQSVTGQAKMPAQLALLLYKLIPLMKKPNGMLVMLTGDPDEEGRWKASQAPSHQFVILGGDQPSGTLSLHNPWFEKAKSENKSIAAVANAMAGTGSQLDIINFEIGPVIKSPLDAYGAGGLGTIASR